MQANLIPSTPQPEQDDLLTIFLAAVEQALGTEARDAATAMLQPDVAIVSPDLTLLSEVRDFSSAWLEQRGVVLPPPPEVRAV